MHGQFNIPSIESIRTEFIPLIQKIEEIERLISKIELEKKYYRNKDLKLKFGFSDNTIINYRESNSIPWTKIGEIYLYPVNELNKMLLNNSNYK
tara:strand:+ start:3952 stop:4233 length:282 start_codon:yes stop_codon:yes gene_type:complete